MTLITFQDGKVVMRDGQVGTEQDCCCGGEPCVCPANIDACPDTFDVTFTGFGAFDPACTQDFTFTISKNDLDADGIADGWQGGVTNFISITLYCVDGRWNLGIGADNYPFECPVVALQSVDLGCGCPNTGTFNVTDAFGGNATIVVA